MGGLVWLASYPKSGNTWARAFLHNLLGGRADTQDISAMNAFTITGSAPGWYKPFIDRRITEIAPEALAPLRPKVHEAIARSDPGRILVKTHNALVVHGGAPMITMALTAGAVYFLRNPLDVAVSYSHHMDCSIDEAIALMALKGRITPSHERGVYQLLGSWSENAESWTRKPNPALHVMRYEDMLDRPVESFGALAGFLQIAAAPDALARGDRALLLRPPESPGAGRRLPREARHGPELLPHRAQGPMARKTVVPPDRRHRRDPRRADGALRLFAGRVATAFVKHMTRCSPAPLMGSSREAD